MVVTRKRHRLAVKWNPRDLDTHADCTPRITNADLRYILGVLSKEVLAELERRGYDLRTMRFHIDKTPAAIAKHESIYGKVPDMPAEPQAAAQAAGGNDETK